MLISNIFEAFGNSLLNVLHKQGSNFTLCQYIWVSSAIKCVSNSWKSWKKNRCFHRKIESENHDGTYNNTCTEQDLNNEFVLPILNAF